MQIRFVSISLLLFWCFLGQAQTKLADSLFALLNASPADTTTALLHIELAKEFVSIDLHKAETHARSALQLAEKIQYSKGRSAAYNILGMVTAYLGENTKGLEMLNKALEIRKQENDLLGASGTLNNIGIIYDTQGDYPTAIKYYEQALAILENLHDSTAIISSLNNLGVVYLLKGNYEHSLEYSFKALRIMDALHDSVGSAETKSNIASSYFRLGKYQTALEYCFQALPILERNNRLYAVVATLNVVGSIYKTLGKADIALQYLQRAEPLAIKLGDKQQIGSVLQNIATVYSDLKDTKKAIATYESLIDILIQTTDRFGLSAAYNNLALIYQDTGDRSKSLELFQQSLKLKRAIGDKHGEALTLLNIGVIYQQQKNLAAAIKQTSQALHLSTILSDKEIEITALGNLSGMLSQQGNYREALRYLQRYSELKDTLLNKEMTSQIAEMQTKYETEKKENEIQLLKKEKEIQRLELARQKILQYSFIGGIVMLAVLALVLFNRYRLKKRSEAALREKNTQLQEANHIIEIERDKSEQLLLNVLPPSIAQRLKDKEETIADRFSEATILFADIAGFTKLSSEVPADEVVKILNSIFTQFDALTEKHHLEKIKTIGDCYMAVGGIPLLNSQHCEETIEMAFDMIDVMDRFNLENHFDVRVRVGINTGEVVAGVIGRKKFIYDLWGDVVNTASRMESHGEPSRIHVTESVYTKVSGKYIFEDRGTIDVKGKGPMRTYFVLAKR